MNVGKKYVRKNEEYFKENTMKKLQHDMKCMSCQNANNSIMFNENFTIYLLNMSMN